MMVSKATIKTFSGIELSPADILYKVNEEICENNKSDMFVTVWLGILEISSGRLVTANAGHKLFVYTDGVPEATDAETRMFGTGRMIDALP